MTACESWYGRDFLLRHALHSGAVLLSPTEASMPDGRLVNLPAPCDHDPLDCPPLPPGHPLMAVAA